MRRNRKLREHRERLLKERSANVAGRRAAAKQRIAKRRAVTSSAAASAPAPTPAAPPRVRSKRHRRRVSASLDYSACPASKPALLEFVGYKDYKCQVKRPVKVCHILDSIGLGGAQTMTLELINGLNKYYGDYCENPLLYVNWKVPKKQSKLFVSYGVKYSHAKRDGIRKWCKKHAIDVVVHHRTSQSQCLKKQLPTDVKYVLVNHTWNTLFRVKDFIYCDFYVSVCRFLNRRSPFQSFIHPTRKLTILNGAENDYLSDIQSAELEGDFKTGRCHRLVPSKFKPDSLKFLADQGVQQIPGLTHHLIGHSSEAKALSKKISMLHCHGSISDRAKKMSILKGLDLYFYETFGHEGASVAILESLACGVPVICKPLGGNGELVTSGVNGIIAGDRNEFLKAMTALANEPDALKDLKQQTIADFDARLHVRHTACKYMQMFENLLNAS